MVYLYKSISNKLEGPYDLDDSIKYYNVYGLRVHQALLTRVSDPEGKMECGISYVAQAVFPTHSSIDFAQGSAFYNYYPQILMVYEKF